ncbi:leucyl/phenylalanyl-tRNA--protein transferase [Deinococcus peraridilitoris]|uniref:Leucyl/phenylalanyl-tRNA--protein transferase n=1 Tax=Deinococcus peraridilitoris (strain DSM 19664 / LMG 22246 / CIP 109416 / KR-200) TaxID=937777 RepID=K9ZXS1_DEIPD|nr:leucyl/phenylalanyl-tRNA--protein transferase [Deinococcus peraridilitoris]AFZ65994.1 leucyl/phenylalanyl-tRNA--protein transferase [Deinococcus peraridilitoris DSM 19664]
MKSKADRPDLMAVRDILTGYASGAFLMDNGDGLQWYTSKRRALVPLDERFHVPSSLRRAMHKFEIRLNTDFEGVVAGCAAREETWISDELRAVYRALHRAGFAHSFETWQDGRLAGGVLGITLGGAFIGESMFHVVTDASKVALVRLVGHLRTRGFILFDAQIQNPHLARFGTFEVGERQYAELLQKALSVSAHLNSKVGDA